MCLRCLQALNTEVAEVTKGWDCRGGNFLLSSFIPQQTVHTLAA